MIEDRWIGSRRRNLGLGNYSLNLDREPEFDTVYFVCLVLGFFFFWFSLR
jgi:hypothetical protein